MDELARRIDLARQQLRDPRDDVWLERAADEFRSRRRRTAGIRRASTIAAAASVLLAAGAGAQHLWRAREAANTTSEPAAQSAAPVAPFPIEEGTVVTPFDALTVLQLKEATPERAEVELVRGGARFEVAHRPSRSFRVQAGPVLVEVLGTEFTVERIATRVRISVLSGQVQVTSDSRTYQLLEGDTGLFPRVPVTGNEPRSGTPASANVGGDEVPALETAPLPASPRVANTRVRSRVAARPWRALAAQGDLAGAYDELQREGWSTDDAEDLLLAADLARRTQHPAEAIGPLKRMLEAHPKDPRASAAAFTLGRVYMDTGYFREAAAAFARAQVLDRQGALTEDAGAREIEAWSRAGDRTRARARAAEYVARYPSGRRIASVRQYGGLE